jgi:hypothetical protein
MESPPEIKFNFDVHEICKQNKLLIDNTGNIVMPLFRLLDDITNRSTYNIQQIYNQGNYFERLINDTKFRIDYEIYNNINPTQSIILHNKYVFDYNIFKAGANCNIANIKHYDSNELLNINQKILNIINPLHELIEKINNDIEKSYDVSLSYEKRIEWKTYMQPLKDQYKFINDQRNYTIDHINTLQNEIQNLLKYIPIFQENYKRTIYPPVFIPISILPPPLPREPMPTEQLHAEQKKEVQEQKQEVAVI